MRAVIFDIDGTLADLEHRRKHLPDWGKFFADMHLDTPITPVVRLQKDIRSMGKIIILCTGRPEEHRRTTEVWLKDNLIGWDYLFMRPSGDYRSDVIVKREILHEKIRGEMPSIEIDYVVDDRQCVVDMWREEGLVCLQCAPGDFDKHLGEKYPSGKLTLLIGPSGSGKTTYAYQGYGCNNLRWEEEEYFSTDAMRQLLCGDFKDQSKNSQVFSAIHTIAKARLQHGLDVVIDATNIRDKDRKTFLDLAPADCEITYLVFNRPMATKVRHGWWRNKVEVKGQPLMEYHENTFRSNLKHILYGDGDPRVTVENHIVP